MMTLDTPRINYVSTPEEHTDNIVFESCAITTEPEIFKFINEIANLQYDWDGYKAIVPNSLTLSNVKAFLKNLETDLFNKIGVDNIIVNPHGTVSIRLGKESYLNIEFGENYANYYARLNGRTVYKEENVKTLNLFIPYEIKLAVTALNDGSYL